RNYKDGNFFWLQKAFCKRRFWRWQYLRYNKNIQMTKETNSLKVIQEYPVIPVYYNENADTCIEVLKACYAGGVRVFEFTNRGANAPQNFEALLAYRNEHFTDMQLGIGTIKTVVQ